MLSKNRKIVLDFQQIVAGALLKFRSIDILDLELIVAKLEERGFVAPEKFDYKLGNICEYITRHDNGEIGFRKRVDDNNAEVRDLFKRIAGRSLLDFFANMDVIAFKKEKGKMLDEQGNRLLNSGRVLLISDDLKDSERFREYGFRNVDHFTSVVRAESYFFKRPLELDNYQVIVLGRHLAIDNFRNRGLTKRINVLKNAKRVLVVNFSAYELGNTDLYYVSASNYRNWQQWFFEEKRLDDAMRDIVSSAIAVGATDSIECDTEFAPCRQDLGIIPKKELPKTVEDINILYLTTIKDMDSARKVVENLGLRVTFVEEDNFTFDQIVDRLSDFDIIIGSDSYSKSLSLSSVECSTQCKYTGKPMVLLATYKNQYHLEGPKNDFDDVVVYGKQISLDYTFGNYSLQPEETRSIEFGVPKVSNENEDIASRYMKEELGDIEAVLSVCVNLYNEKMQVFGNESLDVGNLKSASEYQSLLSKSFAAEEARLDVAFAPIKKIGEIMTMIKDYCVYRSRNLVPKSISHIKISETESGYMLEIRYQGQALSALTFSKSEPAVENVKVFNMRFRTKQGRLSEPMNVGVYPDNCSLPGLPRQPKEREWDVINGIYKKLLTSVAPLVDEAREKEVKGKSFTIQKKN